MEIAHKEYLSCIVGSQREEWIWTAISSHLRCKFPELSMLAARAIVKEFINGSVQVKVCGNCKAEYTELDFEEGVTYISADLCGCCQEEGIFEEGKP